jgi:hypothetical protein
LTGTTIINNNKQEFNMPSAIKIGELEVHHNQIDCKKEIFEKFNRGEGPPLLIAEPQSGKTGVCVCVFDEFIKEYQPKIRKDNPNAKFQRILLCNISDNELTSQTKERLMKAGLEDQVEVYHHRNLDKIPVIPDAYRLFVIDEAHVALGKDRPFHNKLKEFGIDYGSPIKDWEDKNNFVLSVSATPFAHLIKVVENGSFEPVVLKNGKGYYSLEEMNTKRRIKPNSEILDKKGRPTVFFLNLMEDFLSNCGKEGGHFVLRMRGYDKQIPDIANYISEKYPNVTVTVFHSKNKNLDKLSSRLCERYPKPHVNIISGSLRAGKTLETTKYIKMWVETTKKPNADSLLQSICRNCGYEMDDDGNNRKFEDSFPVYCNMKEIDIAMSFYEYFREFPNSSSNVETPSGIMSLGAKEKIISVANAYIEDSEDGLRNILKENGILGKDEKITVSKCSLNNKNNIADLVLANLTGQAKNRNETDQAKRVYYIDSENENFQKSFKKLVSYRPDVIGKYVAFNFSESKVIDKGKLKEKCLFADNQEEV